jgi:hypothetical protein
VTHPSLDELVQQARRDRPAPSVLSTIARGLRVPFVAAPLAALVVPSTATAAVLAKVGLSRAALVGWGAGSVAAVSGVAAAVMLSQPALPPRAIERPPVPHSAASVPPAKVAILETTPEPPPALSVERRVAKEAAPAVWDEPQLIERARKALAAEPRRALALAQEHQRRFPAGALSLEREVIVIEALARSGQSGDARRRALAFEAKYPKSIHLPRIRALRERLGP